MEEKAKFYSFDEMKSIHERLIPLVKGFNPDFMLCYDSRGGLWAELFRENLPLAIPILIGHRFEKGKPAGKDQDNYLARNTIHISSGRWDLYIPNAIRDLKGCKVLLIDDYTFSGDTVRMTKKQLIEMGFLPDRIRGLVLLSSSAALEGNGAPDFWGETTPYLHYKLFYMDRT